MYILEINHGSGEIHRYFLLPGEEYTIGRKECRVLLPNAEAQPSISRHHATISVSAIPKYAAMDPKAQVTVVLHDFSKHGTFVDRERVGKDNTRFIYPEDRIRFGLRVTARVLPVTLPLIVSPKMETRSLEALLDAAVQIGAVVIEDHVPAPADFYQKHINCIGFLFVSDDKFTMDVSMMEALGFGYTLVTTSYIGSLVREIKANDRLMPSEFSAPVPPIPSSLALRSVHYRRPVQTFYSPLEFLSVGSPVSSTVFQDYVMLIPDAALLESLSEILELFGGEVHTFNPHDAPRYRALAASNPQVLAVLTEATFNALSDLVMSRGGGKGELSAPHDDDRGSLSAALLLYRCGVCLIPEENIQLALYRDDPLELKEKTGACYLQRAREDVEADVDLLTSPSTTGEVEGAAAAAPQPPSVVEEDANQRAASPDLIESERIVGKPRLTDSVNAPLNTERSAAPGEESSSRRSSGSGSVPRPTQITVAVSSKPSSPESSPPRPDVLSSSLNSAKSSQARASVGSVNGRRSSSAHLPPKNGNGHGQAATAVAESDAAVTSVEEAQLVLSPEPTSAHSIATDGERDASDSAQNAAAHTNGDTATAASTPVRASAIPPRHQPLSSAVAINRRVAERRRSLGSTPMDTSPTALHSAASTTAKGPSNRLPPKNVVTGNTSARKAPVPGATTDIGGGASSGEGTNSESTANTGGARRLPVSSAPPVPLSRSRAGAAEAQPGTSTEDDTGGRRAGSLAERRPVVVHAAAQVSHSPTRQRVEPVKISTSYSDRRYSLPRGSAGPEEETAVKSATTTGDWGRQGSSHADPASAPLDVAEGPARTSATTGASSSRGTASGRLKRQTVRRESVANRASVTRRASQTVPYQRSDSSRSGRLDTNSGRGIPSRPGAGSVPRSGRSAAATRTNGATGHHPHSLASPVPVRESSTATVNATEMGSMTELAPAPSQTSARRRRSGSFSGSGLPPQAPPTSGTAAAMAAASSSTNNRAASVMPMTNNSLSEGYHADAQLGLQCDSFSKNFLQGFTSETEKVSRMVLRQTYMDSNSKEFFEAGATRLADFLEYMHQHEREIAPMFSTEVTRRSCYDIRQNATYVLRKIKGTFDSVKSKTPVSVQHCRDVLSSRQKSPVRHQTRYNSVSGHTSESSYRRPSRH